MSEGNKGIIKKNTNNYLGIAYILGSSEF